MSESEEKHDEKAGPQENEAGDPEKRRINDPLTSKGEESPRTSWQPQRPSAEGNSQEDDEAGD